MNQKNKTILLIVITIAIWGYSAWEWIGYIQTSNEARVTPSAHFIAPTSSLQLKPQQSQSLKLNYRDPFLTNSKAIIRNNPQRSTLPQTTVKKVSLQSKTHQNKTKEVIWPNLVYSGIINNKFGLLKINDKDYIVVVGDIKDEVKINAISNEKIVVEFQSETKELMLK